MLTVNIGVISCKFETRVFSNQKVNVPKEMLKCSKFFQSCSIFHTMAITSILISIYIFKKVLNTYRWAVFIASFHNLTSFFLNCVLFDSNFLCVFFFLFVNFCQHEMFPKNYPIFSLFYT